MTPIRRRELVEGSEGKGSKSTVLHPLLLALVILLPSTLASFSLEGPEWLTKTLVGFDGATLVWILAAYAYFARKDPDALRSESYSLKKLAIERGDQGDSRVGIIEDAREAQLIEASTSSAEQDSPASEEPTDA